MGITDSSLVQDMVDYDRVAARYQEGRAISDAGLDAWWRAVAPFVPPARPLTVLDLGAGTGIFTRAWTRWCECRVVAVEPSEGMRAAAVMTGLPPKATLVAGVGEMLGLRTGVVHVAWLSTVFHHLRDRQACAEELRRVIMPGGTVLVRGFFCDRGEVGWLRFFPGANSARATFPSAASAAALFSEHGFEPVGALEVQGRSYTTARDAARWARRMRHADTLLGAFTSTDFEQGVAALESTTSDQPQANRLTLLAFVRR